MGGRRYGSSVSGPAIFFVTTSTYERVNLLDGNRRLLTAQKTLFQVVKLHHVLLMGYVLMPNHIHLLIGLKQNGNNLSKFMHSLKGNIRKAIAGDERFWQQRFDDLVINTERQFQIKLNYIHWNPVKRHLVDNPEDWKYSSYRFWALNEENPHLIKPFALFEM